MSDKPPSRRTQAAPDAGARLHTSGVRRRVSGPLPRFQAVSVVVVDDDEGSRLTFEHALARAGFAAVSCADPAAALQRCLQQPPMVVVSDYAMPGMTGVELADRVHEALGEAAPPFVLVSGHSFRELPPNRAAVVLAKPVSPADLVAAVALLLPDEPPPDAP